MGRFFAQQSLDFKFRIDGITVSTGVDIHARDRVGLLFTCALDYLYPDRAELASFGHNVK